MFQWLSSLKLYCNVNIKLWFIEVLKIYPFCFVPVLNVIECADSWWFFSYANILIKENDVKVRTLGAYPKPVKS